MKMRKISLCLFIGLMASSGLSAAKPNIILIMADDLGYGDTGYNGNPVIKTPALDKMAKEGVRFNRFYAAAPVCSPTRASCLTGRHPYRTGVFNANTGILRPEELTLAEVLRKEGYSTGFFGKWHLGTFSDKVDDANRGGLKHPELLNVPTEHGFDTYFATESKVPTWDPMLKPAEMEKPESLKFGWNHLKESEASEPYGTAYWTPDGKASDNLRGDDSRVIMDRAIPFIEQASSSGTPFFTVIWFHAPHLPCVAGPKYAEMYKDQEFELQQFAGCITAMDEQIGRLRAKLEELKISDNTMVWFCSDNGPEGSDKAPGRTGGFRGRKRSLSDGGVRVPGVMVWPAGAKPQETDTPVVTSDYMPTIMDAVGVKLPAEAHVLDGVSILPLLKGGKWSRPAPIAFAIRGNFTYNGETYKLVGRDKLYHMGDDPYEESNIADQHPEIMKTYLDAHFRWYASCKDSFSGGEYGTKSVKRVKQKFPSPLNAHP